MTMPSFPNVSSFSGVLHLSQVSSVLFVSVLGGPEWLSLSECVLGSQSG